MKRFKNILKKVIAALLIIFALILLYKAHQQYSVYEEANEAYDELEEYVTELPDGSFDIDWEALQAINPDIVGWIVMDSGANYPIVQGDDNDYYLDHGFNKEYSINGCIFMNYANSSDFSDENTIIFGHNMNNGSMFGRNKLYMSQSYGMEHPYFYIFVPEGMYTYTIFDTIITTDGTLPYEFTFATDTAYESFLNGTLLMEHYSTGVSISTADRIVSLSTCASYGTKRFIIRGVQTTFTEEDGTSYDLR